MDPVRVTLPREIPTCSFTRDPVVDAVHTMCGHFFEKASFEEYGGQFCPLCKREIKWYADVPSDRWGEEVELNPKKLEIKHRPIENHIDHAALEVDIAKNLVCIAVASGDIAFKVWCAQKDPSVTGPLNYDEVMTEAWVEGLKKYPLLVDSLFRAYQYQDHQTIQGFINAFLKERSNFEIYNFLARHVFLDKVHEGVHALWGQGASKPPFDEGEVIASVEGGKKLRSLFGLAFAICLIIGLSRRALRKA